MPIDVSRAVAAMTGQAAQGQRQTVFATALALTRTGQKAMVAEQKEMRDIFSNPTPYTLSGLYLRPATKQNLSVEVKLKDMASKAIPAAVFLAAQLKGGERKAKRFEKALQSVGALPPGYRIVPGSAAKLDAYGNMSQGQIVQILAFFRAFPEVGYKMNMTAASKARLARGNKRTQGFAYFVGRPGDRLPLGIYQRVRFAGGTAIKPVMIFTRSAVYQAIFDFEYVAERTVEHEFGAEFARAWIEAAGSAR